MANDRLKTRARYERRIWIEEGGGFWFHPEAEEHNSSTYSNWGCRCYLCVNDNTLKTKERRMKLRSLKRKERNEKRATLLAAKREKLVQALPPAMVVGIQRRPRSE